ncbi:uncharacterized protein [Dysidea avara]|uniref:uncharacterized protein n=1 Tax=Dysidea avara TaxID=196820 RepID=UPI003320DC29
MFFTTLFWCWRVNWSAKKIRTVILIPIEENHPYHHLNRPNNDDIAESDVSAEDENRASHNGVRYIQASSETDGESNVSDEALPPIEETHGTFDKTRDIMIPF